MRIKRHILTKEAQFFDSRASDINIYKIEINNAFNKNSREGQFILKALPKNLKGKKILDIGCGLGASTVFMAKRGANVTGIDISTKALRIGKRLAKLYKLEKFADFKIGDVESLPYKTNSIDIVIGKAILHHVDLHKAVLEVHRVLKPGGLAVFSDPLDYNPLIKVYDRFASSGLRSDGERRLNMNDLKTMRSVFRKVNWIGTDITALILFLLYFLYLKFSGRVRLNWYESVQEGYELIDLYKFFNKLDSLLPKAIQLLGWRVVINCRK